MDALLDDLTNLPGHSAIVVFGRMLGAAILCGLVGLERELGERSAGMRTNMLVGFAAATFALLTQGVIASATSDVVRADPTRLIEAVTSGVAFLAAGLIILSKGEVRGLTTGATIWLSAAIGLSIGLGQWFVGLLASVGGLLILIGVRRVERALGTKND